MRFYQSIIAPYATDERELAKKHMARLIELGLKGSLLLLDRWYPSREFIAHTLNAGFFFVMRVREKWNLAVDGVKTQGWVTLTHEGFTCCVRVLKIVLPGGETESLLANLNQKQLPIRNAAELYFKRWGIETACDMLKSRLQLEDFSGRTATSVCQDFYATVFSLALPPSVRRKRMKSSPKMTSLSNSCIAGNPTKTVQSQNCAIASGVCCWKRILIYGPFCLTGSVMTLPPGPSLFVQTALLLVRPLVLNASIWPKRLSCLKLTAVSLW